MKNILEWLEDSTVRYGQRNACSDTEHTLTFEQLRHNAETAGSFFLANGVTKASPVGIYAEKGVGVLSAMLGAVYAGGFYCILDTRQPKERMDQILASLEPVIIVTDEEHKAEAEERFAGHPLCVIEDVLRTAVIQKEALAEARRKAQDTDPLYVNFTSGSTGTPKGVAVCHRSVIDFIPRFAGTFGINQDDVLANQAPFDFDVSVKDIYTMLYTGAHMQMVPRAYFSRPTDLMDLLYDCRATVLTWAVSALCFVSIMNGLDYKCPDTVHKVLFSGEIMPVKHLKKWKQYLPDTEYINVYGPTEITCNCTWHIVTDADIEAGEIPIGKAFDNEDVFLLDEEDRLVTEPGVPGEICVSGTCLALGYYRNAEATSRAFVQNPLNDRWPQRIYRTGDLAVYNEDGDLLYKGRRDHQIKHLGHRIELGEIEAQAQKKEGVQQAAALYDAKRKRIVLVYSGTADPKELSGNLKEVLPAYMCPGKILQKEQMPLNKNGKIDRNLLKTEAGIA